MRHNYLLQGLVAASLFTLAWLPACGSDDEPASSQLPAAGSGGTSEDGSVGGASGTGGVSNGGAAGQGGKGGAGGSSGSTGGAAGKGGAATGGSGTGGASTGGAAGAGGSPCNDGETRCKATTPQTCNSSGTWVDATPCSGSTPLCLAGACIAPSPKMKVAAGGSHACAVTSSGGVKCWGQNGDGQLGNGTTTDSHTAVAVSGLSSGILGVAAGYFHSCALTDSGAVKCWGSNGRGNLGNGQSSGGDSPVPVDVVGLPNGAVAITAGGYTSCALDPSGGVWCWGGNDFGQLGENAGSQGMYPYPDPVPIKGLTSGAVQVQGGGDHVCALMASGGVKCWGNGEHGDLGDGTNLSSELPRDVKGLSGATDLDVSGHACALTGSGLMCWGYNEQGQLGDGGTTESNVPVAVLGLTGTTTAISVGSNHTCALSSQGTVKCWGWGHYGQLGNGKLLDSSSPVDVSGLQSVEVLSSGGAQNCVLATGAVKCWGENDHGQLGNDSTTHSPTPVTVSGF